MTKKKAAVAPKDSSTNIGVEAKLWLLDAMTCTMSPLIQQIIANRTQSRTHYATRCCRSC